MARNPNSVKRVTSYAERLRLGIAVIHGEEKEDESEKLDGRYSPPLPSSPVLKEADFGYRTIPGRLCVSGIFFIFFLSKFVNLTLKASIAKKVVCFSCLLKFLRSLYDKQCGPRSDCSYRSSLILVLPICFYT